MFKVNSTAPKKTRSRQPLGVALYVGILVMLITIASQLAKAETYDITPIQGEKRLDEHQVDSILAPIALYPDSLLSHILIASTYPLEVIKAARWRDNNFDMDADQALKAVEQKNWDPSVKALVAFPELLERLSNDVDWLQQIGDAFLNNDTTVLSRIQHLRHKAKEYGSLHGNDYIDVEYDDDQITIQPVEERVVYVPVYDTRVVYGNWWGRNRPVIWHSPDHYHWHAGFSWSPRIVLQPQYYHDSGFHWRNRHLVVNHHIYRNPNRYNRLPIVRNTEWHNDNYQRWQHNSWHRGNARYRHVQPNVVQRFKSQGYNNRQSINRQQQRLQRVRSYNTDNHQSLKKPTKHSQLRRIKSTERQSLRTKQRTTTTQRTKSVVHNPRKQHYRVSQPTRPTTAVRSASSYTPKARVKAQRVSRTRQTTSQDRASGKARPNQKLR